MNHVSIRTCQSTLPDDARAADDLLDQLGSKEHKIVFAFAARSRDQAALHRALRERLPKTTQLVGASTAGEVTNRGYSSGSVVLGALSGDFDAGVGIGKNLAGNAAAAGSQAVEAAANALGERVARLDPRKHVGVVIDDGFRMKKEELLLGVLEKNQGLVVVGGGAGDDKMQSSTLFVDAERYDNAVLMVLFATQTPWAALRSHCFSPTGQRVQVTKVDATSRRILELDGRPAATRYAELIGLRPDELTFGQIHNWAQYSLALRVGREYFLRAVWKADGDDSLLGMNLIPEDHELDVVRAGDIVESTRRFFSDEVPRRVPNPSAALLFDCNARRVATAMGGQLEALGNTFSLAPPCAGFNVHLETYCGFQINSTLTSLVFGESP
jgi:hypothetical protein